MSERNDPTEEEYPAASSPTPDLPSERVQDLRKAIHAHLQGANIYSQIRDIIDDYAADNMNFDRNSPDDVLRVLQERGLVQQILGKLQRGGGNAAVRAPSVLRTKSVLQGLQPNEKYLHIRVVGGRAFIDNIDLSPLERRSRQLVVCAHYGGQRFRSGPQEAVVDPPFDDDFLVHLDQGHIELVELATPLHISVVKEQCAFGPCSLVGENTIEWRKVLKSGYMSLTVELCGENPSIPAGIVELEIELIPGGPKYPEEEILDRINTQRMAVIAADREFLIYARRWWADYQAVRQSHRQRHVKLFAATTSGRIVPVTHFVSVIGPDRSLDSPESAARFVSLFSVEKQEDGARDLLMGGGQPSKNGDVWVSPFNFLTQRHGDPHSHATLLCSLLLGFGLDAYCVVGSEGGTAKPHIWVLTRRRLSSTEFDITYWEPTTAERFGTADGHKYVSVGCAFNHRDFYANTQEDPSAVTTNFNFDNEAGWMSLAQLKLRSVPKFPNPPLLHIPLNTRAMELDLEGSLRALIQQHRDGTIGEPTRWDDQLSAVLNQALTRYEYQRVEGQPSSDMTMFHSCVKGMLGEGRSFKGFPMNVTHVGEKKIMNGILASPVGKELAEFSAEDLRLALRVRIFLYPEGILSVWVMLALRYRTFV